MSGPRNRVQAGNMPSGRRTSAPARSGALEPEKQTAACSAGAGQRPSPQPAPRSPLPARRGAPSSRARSPAAPPARPPPPGAPARPPGPDAAPAPRKGKESQERGRGREGGREAARGFGPIEDQRRRWLGRRAAAPPPLAKRWHEAAADPGAQVPAAAGEVTGGRGRCVGPRAPRLHLASPLLLHPRDSVSTQRPAHGGSPNAKVKPDLT